MQRFVFVAAVVGLLNGTCVCAAIVPGKLGDGYPSLVYNAQTGDAWVGESDFWLGSVTIRSDAGIFIEESPTQFELPLGWYTPHEVFMHGDRSGRIDLGVIAPPGLSKGFLLQDLSVFAVNEVGEIDFVHLVPEPQVSDVWIVCVVWMLANQTVLSHNRRI